MDRQIVYSGQVPLDTDLLNTNRNVLIALGLLTLDIFGSSTVIGGLPCAPTAPGSLNVEVGPGRIYSLEVVDETAYGSLAADTVDDVVKQGINLASTTLSCSAPGTAGYSINYLIEAMYLDEDDNEIVLPYYNASNPGDPYSGPGGDNEPQPTVRQGVVALQVKAGIPAATGSQTTPAPDAGWTALYIVTVAHGQSAITAGNISVYPGAPFITGALLSEPVADGRYLRLIGGTLIGPVTGTSALFTSITVNGISVQNAAMLTSGLIAVARLGTGAANAGVFLRGDGTWSQATFSNLGNSIANAQVPLAAVSQWQSSLTINGTQVSGPVSQADEIYNSGAGWATFTWSGQLSQPSYVWGSNDGTHFYPWLPSNFNVNAVQGFTPSVGSVASTLVARDGSGNAFVSYLNQSSAQNENPVVSQVFVNNGSDNYLRKSGIAHFINYLDPGASMAPNGYQLLPNGKLLQWATVNLGDIGGGGTVTGTAHFPLSFGAIEGWATDAQDLNGGLGSFVWNTTSVGISSASFGAHEVVSGVVQSCQFRIFAIGVT